MRTFPVDDDVVALVWETAKPAPFEHLSFSDALRRVLARRPSEAPTCLAIGEDRRHIEAVGPQSAEDMLAELEAMPATQSTRRSRAPKTDLGELVRLGLLKEGEELTFVDYKGHAQPLLKATVTGSDLIFGKVRYSMSALASLLLKKEGYIAESVRGPDHWSNKEGKRIRALWDLALEQRHEK